MRDCRLGPVILLALSLACSRHPERAVPVAASPTGPSGHVAPMAFTSGASGPMDVVFPSRGDAFEFRNSLETKYQTGLGRGLSSTYVDREGEVVWVQEYIRYRANGCDHSTALQRVMTQIDGGAAGGICTEPSALFAVEFPSRVEVLEFRRALETKYQQMGRELTQTYVDLEGGVVWLQEYLRYRVNACDHASALQKVFSQIDGGAVPATCFVPCSYLLNPERLDTGASATTGTLEIRPNPVACDWRAESNASWLTFPSDYSAGRTFTRLPYTIAANNGSDRVGRISVTYPTGSQTFTVNQAGNPFIAGFLMTDPARGPEDTTQCHFRSTSTTCTLRAFANLPGNTYTYSWSYIYTYGTQKGTTVTNNSSTLAITDQCGGTDSSAGGTATPLSVTLTISDERGNTITVQTGVGSQPAFEVKLFTC